ncbi:HNH endonuclease [Gudongella sp. SC589]|uniref:HNH endonuclease n=1 Tax=Gudongella sp. SC589 TaxID=3385990 RepID=UPI003904C75E
MNDKQLNKLQGISFYNNACFKSNNYRLLDDPISNIIDSIAVLLGDYNIYRKKAAVLLLKSLLREEFLKYLLSDNDLFVVDRNDYRVRQWRKNVLSRGVCEICGKTENLEAHHIVKWADYPKGRVDLNNGQCLCSDCHINEHAHDNVVHMMRGMKKWKN